MAEKITAQDNQTFQNLAVQATGGFGSLFQFCFDNGVSISDTPVVGQEYLVSDEALALGNAVILAQIKAKDIKIGNLGAVMPPDPVLDMVMLMAPKMAVTGNYNAGIYTLKMLDDGSVFENALASDWPEGMQLLAEEVDDYESDGGAGAMEVALGDGTLSDLSAEFISTTPVVNDVIAWSDGSTDEGVLRFIDSDDNSCLWCPTVYMNSMWEVSHVLLPTLLVEVASADDTSAVLRLTKGHDEALPLHFELTGLYFLLPAGVISTPDPDDAGNPDKCVVNVGPGKYEVGVRATYSNGGPVTWPGSRMAVAIEIAF